MGVAEELGDDGGFGNYFIFEGIAGVGEGWDESALGRLLEEGE